jgi:hypothetical protein
MFQKLVFSCAGISNFEPICFVPVCVPLPLQGRELLIRIVSMLVKMAQKKY